MASHGAAFHAPLETSRMITSATDKIQEARLKLARLLASKNFNQPVPMPDFTSKDALQKYIGLDIPKEKAEKQVFLSQVVPQWIRDGKARESKKPITKVN